MHGPTLGSAPMSFRYAILVQTHTAIIVAITDELSRAKFGLASVQVKIVIQFFHKAHSLACDVEVGPFHLFLIGENRPRNRDDQE